jgi:hypothetical protein
MSRRRGGETWEGTIQMGRTMRVLGINGSPKQNGNTAAFASRAAGAAMG